VDERIPTTLWNLDRLDQRDLPLDGHFGRYGSNMGQGVHVYGASPDLFTQVQPEATVRCAEQCGLDMIAVVPRELCRSLGAGLG